MISKNLTNQAIYNIRQYYFTEGKYNTKDCRIPHYLSKDRYTSLIISFVRLNISKTTRKVMKEFHSRSQLTLGSW